MEGMLSQEEINALLSGGGDAPAEGSSGVYEEYLTDVEKDAVGEISNISMGTAATTLFSLVNNKVTITTPVVSYSVWDEFTSGYDRPCVFIQIGYREGLDGTNILVLKERDVKIITDLMMGGDGTNIEGELSELHLSAISEAMNQMMGSAATSLSSMLNKKIDISPPLSSLIDMQDTVDEGAIAHFLKEPFVVVSFDMEIGDLIKSQIMQLYPVDFAKNLYDMFSGGAGTTESAPQPATAPPPVVQEAAPAPMAAPTQMAMPATPPMDMGQPQMMAQPYPYPPQQMAYAPVQNINAQPAEFVAFDPHVAMMNQKENIDLIMDVPLEVSVELGRTRKSIKDILEFSPGTIIELDKLAGEPVDVLVNGKLVAKGEVVVIEESFGVRVTEIFREK